MVQAELVKRVEDASTSGDQCCIDCISAAARHFVSLPNESDKALRASKIFRMRKLSGVLEQTGPHGHKLELEPLGVHFTCFRCILCVF